MFPSGQLLHVLIVIFLAGIPSLFSLNFRYTYLRLTRYNIGGTMSLQKPAIFLYVPQRPTQQPPTEMLRQAKGLSLPPHS